MDISKGWKKAPSKILIFQTAFLGDVLLSIPLLKSIKAKWPQAKMGLVCRQGVGDFLAHVVDHVIEVKKTDSLSLKEAYSKTLLFDADLIFCPHQSFRSALWVWRLHATHKVGFALWWNRFAFNVRVHRDPSLHDVLRQGSLMTPFGMENSFFSKKSQIEIQVPSNLQFQKWTSAVALAPGSQWNTKRWTTEGYVALAQKLEAAGKTVVLVGAPDEVELCGRVAEGLKNPVNLCGKTSVTELAQVLKKCELLVCNDSGAMHVATVVGTPVVGIFGPTIPEQGYAPWSEKSKVVQADLKCRPCGAHGHQKCPLGTHDCMKKVAVDDVWRAIEASL